MSDEPTLSAKDFGAAFKAFLEQVAAQTPPEESAFVGRFRSHFGAEPNRLPIVVEDFTTSDHPNVHQAIDAYVQADGRSASLLGVTSQQYVDLSLSPLVAEGSSGLFGGAGFGEGPVEYANLTLDDGRVLACVQRGIYLVRDGEERLAVLVRGPNASAFSSKVHIEVMSIDRPQAERFLAEVRRSIWERNVYRGKVISLGMDQNHGIQIRFHSLPKVDRSGIILPAGLLERIERQTVGFARHAQKLLAAGRHLKRGMLLYGAPGTGKTLTAMYLAGQMPGRTVLLLTGRGLDLVEHSCAMARYLQPATVILEDVDLIAEERTRKDASTALLFELLNQMDGLAADVDVLFVLTTNRPDLLEPALASRPGRIDQAVEVPLPDAGCRARLFDLYGRGLDLRLTAVDRYVERTEGTSGAFIRELLRKAALFAADEAGELRVEDRHLDQAMHDLVVLGGELTQKLLGATAARRKRPRTASSRPSN